MPPELKEGWGMCVYKENTLLVTDSRNIIFHVDISSEFRIVKEVKVFVNNDSKRPYFGINELEMVNGKLFANVFMSNNIIVVDPETGFVEEVLDFNDLVKDLEEEYENYTVKDMNNCLNGIAFNEEK